MFWERFYLCLLYPSQVDLLFFALKYSSHIFAARGVFSIIYFWASSPKCGVRREYFGQEGTFPAHKNAQLRGLLDSTHASARRCRVEQGAKGARYSWSIHSIMLLTTTWYLFSASIPRSVASVFFANLGEKSASKHSVRVGSGTSAARRVPTDTNRYSHGVSQLLRSKQYAPVAGRSLGCPSLSEYSKRPIA